MQLIEALLRQEIGLDAASIGSPLIERTIRLRMKHHGLKQVEAYRELLDTSPEELTELTEAVVVKETWFFRDREPFNAFVQLIRTEWLPRHPAGPLRVLSVPCSSGEEPYSLAMALLDAGITPNRFAIDAVDISANALARAAKGIYGKNSFRGRDHSFRERYFQPTKDGYVLSPTVRTTVKFRRENMLDAGFLTGSAPYDFILCRNLLIYFDRATQVLALEKLHRLLSDHGVLFVGPAEMPLVGGNGFVSANLPLAFACRKANGHPIPAPPRRRKVGPALAVVASAKRNAGPMAGSLQPEPAAVRAASQSPVTLATVRELADTGRIEEAMTICEDYLARNAPSAEAYYLLGLLKDASDDAEAITYYRKALYLEPNHYEALVHIALGLEKHGDLAGAQPFKRRAERAARNPTES